LISKDLEDWLSLGLKLLEVLDHLGPLVLQSAWDLLVGVQALVHIHREVHHAGVGEEVQLAPEKIRLIIVLLDGEKLQEGKDQMPVQVRTYLGGQVPVSHSAAVRALGFCTETS